MGHPDQPRDSGRYAPDPRRHATPDPARVDQFTSATTTSPAAAALPRRDHQELASIAREHAHTADDKATIDAWEAHWLQADNTTRLVDHRQPGDHRPWTDLAHELGMHTERINPSQIQSGDLLVANSRGASALLAVTDHSPDATMGMLARTRDGGRPFLLPDVLAFRERRWPASRSGNRELWRITRG